MSNKKKAKHQSKKSSVAKNIAGGAVGTIFNVVLIIVAVMLIYYLAVSAYQYGKRDCFIFRSAYPTIQRTALWRATMCFPLR